MSIRPRRSLLFMPGANARAHEKARTLPADGVIFDLEDSVAPQAKAAAREQVGATLRAGGFGARELVVRVNGLDMHEGRADLAMAAAAGAQAILAPKIATPQDVRDAAAAMREAGCGEHVALWIMIETARAVLDIAAIAALAREPGSPLALFVLGTNDLARETGARLVPGRAPMLPWIASCVLAARAHGLSILDSVYNDFRDEAGLRAECEQGRDLGMDGKTLIHPAQIAAANAAFAPPADEVARARRIVAAFAEPQNEGRGVIQLDGAMVERLHETMARRTLALADAIASRGA